MRAPIVLMIFADYCLHSLGLGELCDKLNSDLDRYPPPQPNHKDGTTYLDYFQRDRKGQTKGVLAIDLTGLP